MGIVAYAADGDKCCSIHVIFHVIALLRLADELQ
jgi:hypothetical protein